MSFIPFVLLLTSLGLCPPVMALHSTPSKDFIDNLDGTVTHKPTNLVWKRCAEGQIWDSGNCNGAVAQFTYSDTKALSFTFATQQDWRLPTIAELNTIVEREIFASDAPAINTSIFPNTPKTIFWSSSSKLSVYSYRTTYWTLNFNTGIDEFDTDQTYITHAVRLVRGGQPIDASGNYTPSKDFNDHADGTVTHKPTNLMWQRCAIGQLWDGDTCTGTATGYDPVSAQKVSNNFAGHNDWRLPTLSELNTLIEYANPSPTINTHIFPNAPNHSFWTTTTTLSKQYWGVNFDGGAHRILDFIPTTYSNSAKPKIRLVRSLSNNPNVTNNPPLARFTATPVSGYAPLNVTLNATDSSDSDGNITEYAWSSSDGQKTTGLLSEFILNTIGPQLITLTVTDNQGAKASAQKNITVLAPVNQIPYAAFTATPTAGIAPLTVNVDATSAYDSDGSLVSYNWKTSHGLSASGKTTQFIFTNAGQYSITLSVTDNSGASSNVTKTIAVSSQAVDLGYNTTARLQPQVIMAGVSPSIIDLNDTEFDVLALVRPGIQGMHRVTLGQGANSWLQKSMQHINTLPNGDQFWRVTFAFARGAFGNSDIPLKWGGGADEFFIRASDNQQQSYAAQQFPSITIANMPAQVAAIDRTHTDELTFNATKRLAPQIIMAGVSPALVDIADTAFDIVALVRPGALPIKNVLLQQGNSKFFAVAMNKRSQLKNGDQIWAAEFAFPQGSLGLNTLPIVWGNGLHEFTLQVIDAAQQVVANYPTLKSGVFPAQ